MELKPSDIIIIILILSGGVFSIIIALAQLMVKDKKNINYASLALFLLYGICLICDTHYRTGTEYITVHLLYINYPLLLFAGPAVFFYFKILVGEETKLNFLTFLLFVPGIIVFFYFIPFFIQNADMKLSLYPLSNNENPLIRYSFNIIDYSLLGWIVVCFLLSLKDTWFLWSRKTLAHIGFIRLILGYIFFWILLGVFIVYSDVTDNIFLYRIGLLLTNLFIIISLFISYRYPNFFNILRKETSSIRYERSRTGGLDVTAVVKRINDLMEYEKLYTDESLTLNKLSERLNITPHQLSEIINKNYDENFNSFINTFRIDAVKKILAGNRDCNVLSTAFGCGFNSKSTFNSAFLKSTGMTPTAFRDKNLKK